MELEILSYNFPILFSFLLFMFMILRIWKKIHTEKPSRLPPGPRKFPIVGNIPQLMGRGLPHQRFRELADIYGPVMSIQQGQIPSIVVSSSETAKEILKTQGEIFADRPRFLTGETIFYNYSDIFFASNGEYWAQMKKIATLGLLSAKQVCSVHFKSVREEHVSKFVDSIRSKSGSSINIPKSISDLLNKIMVKTTLGEHGKSDETLLSLLDNVQKVIENNLFSDVFPSFQYFTGERSRMLEVRGRVDKILDDIISERKTKTNHGNENFLDVLLNLQKNEELRVPLTNESIKANILEMFIGGSDTTSKAIEGALAELMKNPDVMRKAQEEVRRVFGENGKIDESRLGELNYLKLVIKESLRLHPPSTLFVRKSNQKTKVHGYDIFPNTMVLINVWAIGRDPDIWSEPEKFYPERFKDSEIEYKGAHTELIPFGAGKRICPGVALATTFIELFLANLLYHFDWKLPSEVTRDTLDSHEKTKQNLCLIPIFRSPTAAKLT